MRVRAVLREAVAGLIVFAVLVGIPLGALAYEKVFARQFTATVWARTPERGGFSPRVIHARAGEQVRLRIIGDDVVHGFFLPDLGVSVPQIKPGEEYIVEFTPEKPGTYNFMCTVICSPRHGLMNGQLVVAPR